MIGDEGSTIKEIEDRVNAMEPDAALDYIYKLSGEGRSKISKLMEKCEKRKVAYQKERKRFDEMCKYERFCRNNGAKYVAGIDEAGRGPLAGPVVAAAVMLPDGVFIENLNDSKQLSAGRREYLYDKIIDKAIAYGIGIVDEKCIDEINILNATIKAMEKAVYMLKPRPEALLIDAVSLKNLDIRQVPIIKGDCLSVSIAAASIIAKVTRDRIISEADSLYPQYGFARHKGYGTREHIEAIKKYGISPIHRISFTKKFIDTAG